MNRQQKTTLILTALLALPTVAQADVLVSVKPLGFISSAITEGVTQTQILVPPGASPHDYSLKVSDIEKVKSADLVLWIGQDIDAFLTKPISQIEGRKTLTISNFKEISPLLGKGFHDHAEHDHSHLHEHQNEHHEHAHDEHGMSTNWHIWYSPEISKIIADKLAAKLIEQYPDKEIKIKQNLVDFNRTLEQKNIEIKSQLTSLKNKGFYVFHDAYGYFNDAYGLQQTGYFTINPLVTPGAKTLANIKQEIAEHKVACLFAEPQFTPKVIDTLSKGTQVKIGRLDPIGESIKLGKNAYTNFLQFTADSYTDCLK
ncbi:zinc ABC transporter substrate-binding protein ZnuA [Rodentibacter caecimuris]|uniref:High-affinity zinc uptake system protein ZnuA n=1 Tax=Rodentibacter caecimuris TaxID=1796644 RepID=A0ABX3L0R1_9PAST|nr:zinc ABC transporter substrate-binding protein [Rodentibacter heylii]